MTIEAATPAVQYEVRRQAVIAASLTQKFAHRADPITAAQAVAIDAALLNLQAALAAAGYVPQGGGDKAMVTDMDIVKVAWGSAQNVGGIARVVSGQLAQVIMPSQATVLQMDDNVPVQTTNGGVAAGGKAVITGNVLSGVALQATSRIVTTGNKVDLGTVTGTGKFATVTIVGGVITATALSAS